MRLKGFSKAIPWLKSHLKAVLSVWRSILNRQAREYNVLLHDDVFSDPNWRQYAMNVLFQVFENCTIDNAMQAVLLAHMHGVACLIICRKREAERYWRALTDLKLHSTIKKRAGPTQTARTSLMKPGYGGGIGPVKQLSNCHQRSDEKYRYL